MAHGDTSTSGRDDAQIAYREYRNDEDMRTVMALVDVELSEPYSIFTYRYFLHTWPNLCYLALDRGHCFGTIVAKLERHRDALLRGYIAMLVVEKPYRVLGVGSQLVMRVLKGLVDSGCEEVVLEAEVTNIGALRLYERLGFVRDKRLKRYYLNGSDAYRLKLLLPPLEHDAVAAEQLDKLRLEPGCGVGMRS